MSLTFIYDQTPEKTYKHQPRTEVVFDLLEIYIKGVDPNRPKAIRPKAIGPKANRPKMVHNNGKLLKISLKLHLTLPLTLTGYRSNV